MSDIRLDGDAFFEDPYPTYRRMRNNHPAFRDEATGFWFLSRHADVIAALAAPDHFSSARGNALVDSPQRVGMTLGSMDPPRHDELRRVIMRGVTPQRIEAMIPAMRAHLAQILERVVPSGQCDFVRDISRPVLFGALGRMLGLDDEAAVRAAELSAMLFRGEGGPAGPALSEEYRTQVVAFIREQLEKRRSNRSDDLLSVLIEAQEAGAPLADAEIVANMMTVLLAGNASIGHFLPNLVHALWLHPEQRHSVKKDPSLADAAIEEGLRWDTSTQCFARQTTREVEIAGARIAADSRVVLIYASANRDDAAFENAEKFDLSRGRTRHVGFGSGPHICLGAPTARAMLRPILQDMLATIGDYELDLKNAVRVKHLMARGFRSLPISW
ncbi:MAG: cytochrome P450 [Beijerinckiaceae bacterium]